MVFSSLIFTYFFLPLVIILYYVAKEKYRNYILLIASICFYSYGEPTFVLIMLGSIVVNYVLALLINSYREQQLSKLFLVISIAINIGVLFVFKYLDFAITIVNRIIHTNFTITEISLPIGISFFTFQALSYVIDVYRGTVAVQKNPLFVALYISFFPQLIAGPIVRYSTIEEQITNRKCTPELFSNGTKRFMLGFCKKIIFANNLSVVAQEAFSNDYSCANPLFLWIGSICFSLQIYYDFSGYSDMAIGLGRLFGFKFEENFNYPYISKSITEFWRRWHISLSQWFRDYVYIPLGGGHVSKSHQIFNLFVVWMLTGIWHGANYTFIAWGFGYFILLILEKFVIKPSKRNSRLFRFIWQIITLIVVNFEWVLFNSKTLSKGIQYCLAMIGYYGNAPTIDSKTIFNLQQYGIFIVAGIIFATPFFKKLESQLAKTRLSYILSFIEPLIYSFAFLWATSFLVLGAHNPFIYFNF